MTVINRLNPNVDHSLFLPILKTRLNPNLVTSYLWEPKSLLLLWWRVIDHNHSVWLVGVGRKIHIKTWWLFERRIKNLREYDYFLWSWGCNTIEYLRFRPFYVYFNYSNKISIKYWLIKMNGSSSFFLKRIK